MKFSRLPILGFFVAVAAVLPTPAYGLVSFSLGTSMSESHVPLQNSSTMSGTGSIAVGLTSFLRLGITHRQEIQQSKGWTEYTDPDTQQANFYLTKNKTHVTANSLDLTVILYQGDTFTPYALAGAVMKVYKYEIVREIEGMRQTTNSTVSSKPLPNFGGGIAIRLRRNMSMKLSHVASPGYMQEPGGEIEGVWDRNSSIEISFDL